MLFFLSLKYVIAFVQVNCARHAIHNVANNQSRFRKRSSLEMSLLWNLKSTVFFYFYKPRNTSRSNWSWRGKGVFFFLGERIPILTYESFQHAASKSKISASQTIGNVAINRFKEYANHKRSTFSIIQISNL